MKVIYYVTDLGLGHASRTIAIARELKKKQVKLIIRNDDPHSFFRQSLQSVKIVHGQTDFGAIIDKRNPMKIDDIKTKQKISKWIERLPQMIEKESRLVQREKPDVIVSDISIMPILAAKKNNIPSIAISNFVWSDTLNLGVRQKEFFEDVYDSADLVIKLPFGTCMKFRNTKEYGLVARNVTETRNSIRKKLKITSDKKLVVVSLGGFKEGISIKHDESVKILDISNYTAVMKLRRIVNFVEGQNLVNASDLVICKCGYGFTSECLSNGVPFRYVLEPTHGEAFGIHKGIQKLRLDNKLSASDLRRIKINEKFIDNTDYKKVSTDNQKVAEAIMRIAS